MNNWTDHGFYQISPTLFFDFYSAAGFENFKLRLHFINGQEERQIEHRWPDDPLPYGIGRGVRILCHFTAIKAKEVNIDKLTTLVQRRYRQHFGGEIDSLHTDARQQSRWNKLQNSIKKRTFFLRAAKL
ncbi:MAG: hypothetical protein FGM18_07725 [Burkholderiaceae bacterium]|nr:hypothetical protein [Burkholderiaceae bacterium]